VSAAPDYVLRNMRFDDIPQVVAIDRVAFPVPWSSSVYRYEIGQNSLSYMVVLARSTGLNGFLEQPASRLQSLLGRLRGRLNDTGRSVVVGYGGFWFSRGQAHISTIATHPDMRGQGLGEVLLAGMIRRALHMQAQVVSLEVRVSNAPAIALYRKYAFMRFGVKDRYYRDNGEDAYDMRVSPVDVRYHQQVAELWQVVRQRVHFADHFTVEGRRARLF
jgi:ribosomal-protein-alanine N-acetyltransferase